MSDNNPFWEEKKALFESKAEQFEQEKKVLNKQTNKYGTIRLLFFIAAIIAAVYFINERNASLSAIIVLVGPFIFGWLVKKHNLYKKQLRLVTNKLDLLADEKLRLKLELNSLDGGEEFEDHSHPFTTDMDVFGKHSLFALINRSKLSFGRTTLAKWFQNHAEQATIANRQTAAAELKEDFDWQLDWWAENSLHQNQKTEDSDLSQIFDWFEQSNAKPKSWLKVVAILGLLQFWVTAILIMFSVIPAVFVGASLFLNLLLLGPVQQEFIRTQGVTQHLSNILNQHSGLFKMISNREFHNGFLNELKSKLTNPDAAEKIKILNRSLTWMHSRNGMMYWVLDPFVMTDYWVLSSSQNWRYKYGKNIRAWFDTIGDFEALLSLAGFSFVHNTYSTPEFENSKLILVGKAIGHPLIKHEERVSNDFYMQGKGSLTLITGANMSGKSTFERSLGINIILAQMGAVCCTADLTLSPLQLFTSMRTQDDLSENTSSFYAELKRLKQLVDLTQEFSTKPIFYLLDEILKGTNSEDRNKGAESLIRQLNKTYSMGLISTHDLSLASLEKELAEFKNFSFNSEVKEDEILFDYKLYDGPCHTFNAVPLMKKMGIEIV